MRDAFRALALLALAAVPAAAEPRVSAQSAFGGVARTGAWTAVRVEVVNPDAELRLHVEIDGEGARSVRDITVPAGSRHAYWIPVRARVRMDCRITGGPVEFKDTLSLSVSGAGERLFLAVSDAPVGLPEHELWKTVLASGDDLPDFSDAYGMFDAVVVRFPNPGLPTAAADALRRWTQAGGVLAVCAGMGAKEAADSRLASVLPVVIAGTTEVTSLAAIDPALAAPAAPFPVADARPRPGADPAPFGASGPAGLGRALFLGFDPLLRPVAEWGGLAGFWKVQLPLRPNAGADTDPPEGDEKARRAWLAGARSESSMLRNERTRVEAERIRSARDLALAGRTVQLGWFFALLVGYLIVIGPVDYFVLRALRRQAWTWVTLPLAIAAFCAAAWGLSERTKARDSHIVAIGTIDVFPDGTRETAVYLVVAPLSGTQEISTASPDSRLWPASDPDAPRRVRGEEEILPELAWGPQPALRRLAVQGWQAQPVVATTDLPPGAFSARREGDRIVVQAPGPLRATRLQAGPGSRDGGDIEPGGAFPGGPNGASPEEAAFRAAVQRWFADNVRDGERSFFTAVEGTEDHPVLTGWIERPAAAPSLAGEPPARAFFLVRFHLEKSP
ncbi:MAG: hypothetical protein IT452_16145 [Planctomycetia bacterium]|nr:hypothetical protein [Planctomycetia bacterium]